ncbi:MAG: twin-arginine translocation signal domain-containing protein [Coriobacteriia bacterium]|nr:twin-arginine translocation signal domain-containing protein [Coriobacteriia bacterium]
MATKDIGQPLNGMTRRAFLKTAAVAGAVASCGFDIAYDAEKAFAYENDTTNFKVTSTTCPYCSASCGQRVVTALTGANTGKVIDIYGDYESPMNSGGLCAKGAGSLQLVNNPRRIGAFSNYPVSGTPFSSGAVWGTSGVAYKRDGASTTWTAVALDTALDDIASKLVTARGGLTSGGGYNSKGVAFLGSSHMNNESNYMYRKIIANFGTSNVEHQARI